MFAAKDLRTKRNIFAFLFLSSVLNLTGSNLYAQQIPDRIDYFSYKITLDQKEAELQKAQSKMDQLTHDLRQKEQALASLKEQENKIENGISSRQLNIKTLENEIILARRSISDSELSITRAKVQITALEEQKKGRLSQKSQNIRDIDLQNPISEAAKDDLNQKTFEHEGRLQVIAREETNLNRLQSTIDSEKAKIIILDKNILNTQSQISSLKQERSKKLKEIESYEALIEQLKALNITDATQMRELEGQKYSSEQDLTRARRDLEDSQRSLKFAEQDYSNADAAVRQVQNQIQTLRARASQVEKELQSIDNQIAVNGRSIATKEAEITELENQKNSLERQAISLEKSLVQINQFLRLANQKLRETEREVQGLAQELAKENATRSSEARQLDQSQNSLNQKNLEIRSETNQLRAKEKELSNLPDDQENAEQRKLLLSEIGHLKEKISKMDGELPVLKSQVDRDEERLRSTDRRIAVLQNAEAKAQGELLAARNEIQSLESKKKQVDREVLDNERAQQRLQDAVGAKIAEVSNLKTKSSQLQFQKTTYQEEGRQIHQALGNARIDLDLKQADYERRKSLLSQAQSALRKSESTKATLEDNISRLSTQISALDLRISARDSQVAASRSSVRAAEDRASVIISKEIPRAESAITEYQSQIFVIQSGIRSLEADRSLLEAKLFQSRQAADISLRDKINSQDVYSRENGQLQRLLRVRNDIAAALQEIEVNLQLTHQLVSKNQQNIVSQNNLIGVKVANIQSLRTEISDLEKQLGLKTGEITIAEQALTKAKILADQAKQDRDLSLSARNQAKKNYDQRLTQFNKEKSEAIVLGKTDAIGPAKAAAILSADRNSAISAAQKGEADGKSDGSAAGKLRDFQAGKIDGDASGQVAGETDGRLAGEKAGKILGTKKGLFDGEQKGLADGQAKGNNDGYEEGYAEEYNDRNRAAGAEVGGPAGLKAALETAFRENYPQGEKAARAEILNVNIPATNTDTIDLGVSSRARSFARSNFSEVDEETRAFLFGAGQTFSFSSQFNNRSLRCVNSNSGIVQVPSPAISHESDPSYDYPPFLTAYRQSYDESYLLSYTEVYQGQFLRKFKEVYSATCEQEYQISYIIDNPASRQLGFDEGYGEGHKVAYNRAFALASSPNSLAFLTAYDEAFQGAFPGSYELAYDRGFVLGKIAGKKEGEELAFTEGREAEFDSVYQAELPSARENAFAEGYRNFADSLQNRAEILGIEFVVRDENNDGIYVAGEKVSLDLTLRNFGGQPVLAEDLSIVIRPSGLISSISHLQRNLEALPAQHQRVFKSFATGLLYFDKVSRELNFRVDLDVLYKKQGLATLSFTKSVQSRVELQAKVERSLPNQNHPPQAFNQGSILLKNEGPVNLDQLTATIEVEGNPNFFGTDANKVTPILIGSLASKASKTVNFYLYHRGNQSNGKKNFVFTLLRSGQVMQKYRIPINLVTVLNPK